MRISALGGKKKREKNPILILNANGKRASQLKIPASHCV